jgi:hypothetical protein
LWSDRSQLSRMTEQARAAVGSETIEAVADRGYYSGEEIVFLGISRAGHVDDGRHDIRQLARIVAQAARSLMPRGQCTMKGVAMPPSWTQCL